MVSLAWDRLLETCNNRGSDILLAPGSKPLIRVPGSWTNLELGALLRPKDIRNMANELFQQRQPDGVLDNWAYFNVAYGENYAWFRVFAFGFPKTSMLIISRCPSDPSFAAAS